MVIDYLWRYIARLLVPDWALGYHRPARDRAAAVRYASPPRVIARRTIGGG